ncbi:MAG TPA: hypothetical protein VHO69_15900 [Phototrophicaceae bacterium]|nr:hypothetical protein [Phototrophicaceae bacterium]
METEKPKAKNEASEEQLEAVIGFTPADLEANRDGQLSDGQKIRFRGQRNLILAFAILVMVCIPFVALTGFVKRTDWGLGAIGLILFLVLSTFGTLAALALVRIIRLMHDLQDNRAEAVQGPIKLEMHQGYHIVIGDQMWHVHQDVFLAFKNGEPYCLYYAPHSRTLLSAEWLREG